MSLKAPVVSASAAEVKNTTCYMCACRCGIRVHLRDGDGPLHRRQSCASHQQGRDLRQGFVGDHEAVFAGAADAAAAAQGGCASAATGEFEAISWDEAFALLETRLAKIRAEDPKKFALFTGRDQMQALTGLFARQFGTPNYAAHGGFCSVNMAAGMIYTIGGSFWEFGGPDLDRAKLFVMIGTAEDHHSNPLKIAISKFKRSGRPLHLDQSGAHRLFGDRRRVGADPPGHRRCVPARRHPRAHRDRPLRPRVPRALHERRPARQRRRGQRAIRHAGAGRRESRSERDVSAEQAVVGPRGRRTRRHTHARRRPVPLRRLRVAGRHAGEARVPVARRADARIHAGVGGGNHRDSGGHDSPPRPRDGHHRARPADRAADSVDRFLGRRARDRDRQPGRVPCDARTRRALERLPDDPRARDPDVAARHHRPPGRLPAQGAVPARDSAVRQAAEQSRCGEAEHAARRAGARLAGLARRSLHRRRRRSGAHRQGLFVGIPAVGARAHAQRDHQRLARRSVPARHAADLHVEHGVELDDEHRRGAQDAERPRRQPASTRFRSSSSATRSSRRRRPSPTWCCPTRRISSATT